MEQVEGRAHSRLDEVARVERGPAADVYATAKEAVTARDLEAKARANLPWRDAPLEEKVERLRRELLMQRDATVFAGETAREAHELAHEHQHSHDGAVLKPARSGRNRLVGRNGAGRHDPLA